MSQKIKLYLRGETEKEGKKKADTHIIPVFRTNLHRKSKKNCKSSKEQGKMRGES